jgi:hypothetical protein
VAGAGVDDQVQQRASVSDGFESQFAISHRTCRDYYLSAGSC